MPGNPRYYKWRRAKGMTTKAKKAVTQPKATVALMTKVAKKVHDRGTETKYRGIQVITVKQPNTNANGSTFSSSRALGLEKGDNNQTRDGRKVKSLYIQAMLNISNAMPFPMHLRVLCLRHKDPSVSPLPGNVLVNPFSKAAEELTQFQRDMTNKVNLDLWTVLQDNIYYLWPKGEGTVALVGLSQWSRVIKNYKKTNTTLTYELAEVNVDDQPIQHPISWVYILAFPNGIIPPEDPVAGDMIDMSFTFFHYFKDL